MSDILAAAGTGSSSFYHHFRSKDDVLLAALEHLQVRLRTEVLAAAGPDLPPVERVFAILGFYRRFLTATGCRLGCPVGNLAGELADSHPHVRERLAALFAAWRAGIEACLQPIAADLPPHLPAATLASFVLTVMEGAVMQARVAKSLAPFDEAIVVLRDWFARLVPAPNHHQPRPDDP